MKTSQGRVQSTLNILECLLWKSEAEFSVQHFVYFLSAPGDLDCGYTFMYLIILTKATCGVCETIGIYWH